MLEYVSTYGFAVVGILAMLVSLITELIKGLGVLKNVPTDAVVIVLSVALTMLAYFAGTSYLAANVVWYEVAGVIFGGFIVAYVAMYGWSKLTDLASRFKK